MVRPGRVASSSSSVTMNVPVLRLREGATGEAGKGGAGNTALGGKGGSAQASREAESPDQETHRDERGAEVTDVVGGHGENLFLGGLGVGGSGPSGLRWACIMYVSGG